jgi:hypothetical protein
MKNFFTKSLFSIFLLVCFTTFAFSKDQPKGVIVTKDNDGYKVEFTLPDYYMTSINAANTNFLNLNIPEYGEPTDVGLPNLPQLSFSFMIAYDEKMPVINVLNQIQDLKLLDSKIFPVQQPWPKNLRMDDRPFTIDSKYYLSNGNFNGPFVKVSEPFIIAGVKGVMITLCPFAYNPSTNQLKVTKKGNFRIELKNEPAIRYAPTKSFDEFFNSMFINYSPSKTLGTNRYLIITAPEFESSLAPLVTEKPDSVILYRLLIPELQGLQILLSWLTFRTYIIIYQPDQNSFCLLVMLTRFRNGSASEKEHHIPI